MKRLMLILAILGFADIAHADLDFLDSTDQPGTTPVSVKAGTMTVSGTVSISSESATAEVYEQHDFTSSGITDTNLTTIGTSSSVTAFTTVPTARILIIRTDRNISIRINGVGNDEITIESKDRIFVLNFMAVTSLFITAPSGAVVRITLI